VIPVSGICPLFQLFSISVHSSVLQ
jgi:hypothetical protein